MRVLLLIILGCFQHAAHAQDFDDYRTLSSSGAVPDDFMGSTFGKIEKIENEQENSLNDFDNSEFLFRTRYAVDGLLQSGLVVYGDPVTNYINEVAGRLLQGNPELLEKLRFYTLKVQTPNAFSTDQGVIFVTTGLLSYLDNEAQFAFILAHEISHYTRKHVIKSFTWQKENNFEDNWISEMSKYSRSHETEADLEAIAMYQDAGYSTDAIFTGFDKLAIMDHHFANIPMTKGLYSDYIFIPDVYFSNEPYALKDDSEREDSMSTHPNISNRKDAIRSALNESARTSSGALFIGSEKTFSKIRNIARFELLRSQLLNQDYLNALYSAEFLRNEFPNSLYLKRAKAKAWIGIGQLAEVGVLKTLLQDTSEYSGYVSNISETLRNLSKNQITALALNNVYGADIDMNDEVSNFMVEFYFSFLKKNTKFQFPEPSRYAGVVINDIPNYYNSDSLAYVMLGKRLITLEEYALHHIARDSVYLVKYRKAAPPEELKLESYTDLSKRGIWVNNTIIAPKDRKAYNIQYNTLGIGADKILAVSPRAISYSKNMIDYPRSERHETKLRKAIATASEESGVDVSILDVKEEQENATNKFNQRALILSSIRQFDLEAEFLPFPVDYAEHIALSKTEGTNHVMFNMVTNTYASDINLTLVVCTAYLIFPFPFIASIYVPTKILKGNKMNLTVLFYNIKEGRFEAGGAYYYNESMTVHGVGTHLYEILNATKKPKK